MRKPFTLMQCLNWCVKSAITSSKTVPHFTVKAWDHFGVTPHTHKKMKNYKELATFNHVFLVGLDTIWTKILNEKPLSYDRMTYYFLWELFTISM